MQASNACLWTSKSQTFHDVAIRCTCPGVHQTARHRVAFFQQQAVLQVHRSAPGCTRCKAASAASWQHTASILEPSVQIDMQQMLLERQDCHTAAVSSSNNSSDTRDCLCDNHTHHYQSNAASRNTGSNYSSRPPTSTHTEASTGCSTVSAATFSHTQQQQQHLQEQYVNNIAPCQQDQWHRTLHEQQLRLVQHARLQDSQQGHQLRNEDGLQELHGTLASSSSQDDDLHHDSSSSSAVTLGAAAAAAVSSVDYVAAEAVGVHGNGTRSKQKRRTRSVTIRQQQQQAEQHWQLLQQQQSMDCVEPLQQQQQPLYQGYGLQQQQHADSWQYSYSAAPQQDLQQQQQHYVQDHILQQQHWQQDLPGSWHNGHPLLELQQAQQQQHGQASQQQQQQLHWQHQARLQYAHASQRLSSQIAAAASWREVRDLLEAHESSPNMQPLHVVLLLVRLNQLLLLHPELGGAAVPAARYEQEEYVELVHILLRMAGRSLQQLTQHDLPPLLSAAARLPLVQIPKPWCVRVMTRAHHLMPKFTAEGVATLVWALAKLGMNFRSDFTAKILEEFTVKLDQASPRALAVLAHGLAGVGVRPDGTWMGVFLIKVEQQLERFSGRDLCMCLWALVQLRHAVPTTLLTSALRRLTATLPDCSTHEASLAVWALGKLGHRFGSSSSSSGTDQRRRGKQRHGLLGKQQQRLLHGLKPLLSRMSGRDLTTLLFGLALQHSTPSDDWQSAALAAAQANMHQLDGQGLSNLLYAVGTLKWQSSQQWQVDFWNAVVTQVQQPQQRKEQTQQQQQRGRRRQQQQQVLLPAQHGFAPRTWELLFEGQQLLGWRLPLQQLQMLQQHGQLHRLKQSQLGSWARQAGLSAAAAAADVPGAAAAAAAPQKRRQQQRPQLFSSNGRQQQQLEETHSHSSSSNGSNVGDVTVPQLRVLPPVQVPAAAAVALPSADIEAPVSAAAAAQQQQSSELVS